MIPGVTFGLLPDDVLGLNARNLLLVSAFNTRRRMQWVDDKTITKKLAIQAGIPTPELYGVVQIRRDRRLASELVKREKGAVIKPASGAQGNGIMIITDKDDESCQLSTGQWISHGDVSFHTANIISGMFSHVGKMDVAMVEERVQFDEAFKTVSFKGVPDIRVIVFKGVPISAMLRLPTSKSDGKANLHRGGIGAGISITEGRTTLAMLNNRRIHTHPDTGGRLDNIQVPHWQEILEISAQAYDVTGLGYLGVDIVLDRKRGPLLLELNARPGISIQIATGQGLRHMVNRLIDVETEILSVVDRVDLGKTVWQDVTYQTV